MEEKLEKRTTSSSKTVLSMIAIDQTIQNPSSLKNFMKIMTGLWFNEWWTGSMPSYKIGIQVIIQTTYPKP